MNIKQKNIYGTPTPRTDASEANASARLFDTGANQREGYCLRLDMEQLERELAAAKAELAELRKDKELGYELMKRLHIACESGPQHVFDWYLHRDERVKVLTFLNKLMNKEAGDGR